MLWSRESPFAAVVWLEMLRALVLGWVALARPAEKLRLLRRHLLLPSNLCDPAPVAFVVFALPKGRWSRRAPKTEHVRIDDADAIAFLERTVGSWPPWTRLFPYLSVGDRYRKVWDALFGRTAAVSAFLAGTETASSPRACGPARGASCTRVQLTQRASLGSRAI